MICFCDGSKPRVEITMSPTDGGTASVSACCYPRARLLLEWMRGTTIVLEQETRHERERLER